MDNIEQIMKVKTSSSEELSLKNITDNNILIIKNLLFNKNLSLPIRFFNRIPYSIVNILLLIHKIDYSQIRKR